MIGQGLMSRGVALLVAGLLAGCYTMPPMLGGPEEAVRGASVGSSLGFWLKASDRTALSDALAEALNSPELGTSHRWHNAATGADGTVLAYAAYLAHVDAAGGADLESPVGLDTLSPLGPDGRIYATNSNANVRLSPSVEGTLLDTIAKDTQLLVLGTTTNLDWHLVASGERVLGYMYAPLLSRAGEETLVLAGGEGRPPLLCRRFTSEVRLPEGRTDRWDGTACRGRDGSWSVRTANPGEDAGTL